MSVRFVLMACALAALLSCTQPGTAPECTATEKAGFSSADISVQVEQLASLDGAPERMGEVIQPTNRLLTADASIKRSAKVQPRVATPTELIMSDTSNASEATAENTGEGQLVVSLTSDKTVLPIDDYVEAEILVTNAGTAPLTKLTITAGMLRQGNVNIAAPQLFLPDKTTELCNAQWVSSLAPQESITLHCRWYAPSWMEKGKAMTSVSVSAENNGVPVNRADSLFFEKKVRNQGTGIMEAVLKYGLLLLATLCIAGGLLAACKRIDDE